MRLPPPSTAARHATSPGATLTETLVGSGLLFILAAVPAPWNVRPLVLLGVMAGTARYGFRAGWLLAAVVLIVEATVAGSLAQPLTLAGQLNDVLWGFTLAVGILGVTWGRTAWERLEQRIHLDSLTGILNRAGFEMRLRREVDRARQDHKPLSLVYLDCDHFKQLNDQRGHATGDAFLRSLAKLLQATFRATDTVARLGGDEFVVLLPHAGPLAARRAVERFQRRTEELISAADFAITATHNATTISLGVVTNYEFDRSSSDLLQEADSAMYAAKQGGRNATVYRVLGGPAPTTTTGETTA